MNHEIEKKGLQILISLLKAQGRKVERTNGTFDLLVDGKRAEVKTKQKTIDTFDFVSLTQKQHASIDKGFDIYLVCNLVGDKPEVYLINSKVLSAIRPRKVLSYEYDRSLLQNTWKHLFSKISR